MKKGTILPIAVMAFAIVAFLVLVNFAVSTRDNSGIQNANVTTRSDNQNVNLTVTTNENVNAPTNTNESTNTNSNANTTVNTNTATDATKDWKTYMNTTYNYSIKYPTGYTVTEQNTVGKTTPEQTTFYKGNRSTSSAWMVIYSMTPANKNLFGEEKEGWYDWAINGFPNDGSSAAGLSENKRQETYGGKTFTVVNFDGGSSWSGSPFYYYVSGQTVFIIVDVRSENNVPRNNVTEVHQMLSTFSITNPTIEWKTYENKDFFYSFDHPDSWEIKTLKGVYQYNVPVAYEFLVIQDPTGKEGSFEVTHYYDYGGFFFTGKVSNWELTTKPLVTIDGVEATPYLYTYKDGQTSTFPDRIKYMFGSNKLWEDVEIHTVNGSTNDSATVGKILKSFKWTKPTTPIISRLDLPGIGSAKVAIQGSRAYVANGSEGLHIVDVGDVLNPKFIGSWVTASNANRFNASNVTVAGQLAYVCSNQGLYIVDVSDPTKVKELGIFTGKPSSVAIVGTYAYVADGNKGLVVLDIADSKNPKEVSSTPLNGHARNVIVSGNTLFLASEDIDMLPGAVYIFDISTKNNPVQLSATATKGNSADVAVVNQNMFVADGFNGVLVFSISNLTKPVQVGRYATTGATYKIAVGDALYLTGGPFKIVNISNPAKPSLKQAIPSIKGGGISLDSKYIYISSSAGLKILSR